MNEKAYLYTVHPRKVITGISGVNAIRTSKSLFLTKEDVMICLKNASVYRRFASAGINEKVTVGNIDRLHRENYVAEEDWAKVLEQEMSEGHGKVSQSEVVAQPKEVESKQEEEAVVSPEVTEPISVEEEVEVEEQVEESTVEDPVKDDVVIEVENEIVNEEVTEDGTNDSNEDVTENSDESVNGEQTVESEQKPQQFNYNKKHRK